MKRIKPSELRKLIIELAVKGKLPIMVWGPPGIGKTQIVKDSASELGMDLLDMRLNYYEESDFLGIPVKTDRGMEFVKYAKLPSLGQGIWFLDELTHARTSIQGLVFQLINEFAIEDYSVPDGWRHFVGASNLPTHGSISNPMPSGLANRFTGGHYELVPDLDDWTAWAIKNGVDSRVISFVSYMENNDNRPWLYRKDVEHSLTPRIWATGISYAVSSLSDESRNTAIMGMIGEDSGAEFIEYMKLASGLPDPVKIASGDHSWLQTGHDPSLYYLLVSSLARLAAREPEMLTGCLRTLLVMEDEYAALGFGLISRSSEREVLLKNDFLLENLQRFNEMLGVPDGQP